MKNFSSLFSFLSTAILALVLLQTGLPGARAADAVAADAAAASSVPTGMSGANPPAPDSGPAFPSLVQLPTAEPQPAACDPSRSVHVSGTALINVAPDRALVQLGVQSNGASVRAVERANTNATQAVIKAVRALGVEAKDITTDWYAVEPVYEDYEDLTIKGYRLNNMIAITLRDVSKTSQVISTALQTGANRVINIDFTTSELRKYRDQARQLAMTAAREKAQALATAAGAEAGCVLSINENSWSSYNGWWGWYWRNSNPNQWTQNVVQNIEPAAGESSASGEEPISLGQISVRAEVSASFGLK